MENLGYSLLYKLVRCGFTDLELLLFQCYKRASSQAGWVWLSPKFRFNHCGNIGRA